MTSLLYKSSVTPRKASILKAEKFLYGLFLEHVEFPETDVRVGRRDNLCHSLFLSMCFASPLVPRCSYLALGGSMFFEEQSFQVQHLAVYGICYSFLNDNHCASVMTKLGTLPET